MRCFNWGKSDTHAHIVTNNNRVGEDNSQPSRDTKNGRKHHVYIALRYHNVLNL